MQGTIWLRTRSFVTSIYGTHCMVALRTMALQHHSGASFPRTGLAEDDDYFLLLYVKQLGAAFGVRKQT